MQQNKAAKPLSIYARIPTIVLLFHYEIRPLSAPPRVPGLVPLLLFRHSIAQRTRTREPRGPASPNRDGHRRSEAFHFYAYRRPPGFLPRPQRRQRQDHLGQ